MSTSEAFKFPEFQRRFSELRGDRTQSDFADFLELSRPTVGLYESGKRVPDALTLKRIAEKCNVSADYLLGETMIESRDLDTRRICELTGLSAATVNALMFLRNNTPRGKASFSCAFADRLFSDSSRLLLEAESAIVQAAVICRFEKTKTVDEILSFTPEELKNIYVHKAAEAIQTLVQEAIEECTSQICEELLREQKELIDRGTRPDADFQEIAFARIIKDSDEKER